MLICSILSISIISEKKTKLTRKTPQQIWTGESISTRGYGPGVKIYGGPNQLGHRYCYSNTSLTYLINVYKSHFNTLQRHNHVVHKTDTTPVPVSRQHFCISLLILPKVTLTYNVQSDKPELGFGLWLFVFILSEV